MQQQYDQLLAQLKENPDLLQEILVLSDAMRELSDHAISRILGDSILYLEAIKSWYEAVRTPIAKYSLAEVDAYESKYDQAEIVLREIPALFAFGESEWEEHNNYMQFYHFKKQLKLSERDWTQLDQTEIAYLQTISEATRGRSASMAKGVLCFFFDICFENEIGEDSNDIVSLKNTTVETQTTHIQEQNQSYELFLYPNPTESEMTVTINNPAVKIVEMEILDVFGSPVASVGTHSRASLQHTTTINISHLPNGIYILKIRLDQGDVVIRKVVKQ
jgi:hypothetical protein